LYVHVNRIKNGNAQSNKFSYRYYIEYHGFNTKTYDESDEVRTIDLWKLENGQPYD